MPFKIINTVNDEELPYQLGYWQVILLGQYLIQLYYLPMSHALLLTFQAIAEVGVKNIA